jgi:subtilisin-like proprotein convertase family protein
MNVPRSLNRFVPSLRTLHRVLTICVLVALLAGLIPPPLVRSALPAPVANAVADLLPEPAVAQAAAYSYEQTPNQAISDNSCPTGVTTTIAVADDFTINDLNVGLTIDHTYRNDLDVTLTSPAGTSVILFTDIGSNSTQNFDLLLDDAAATDIGSLTSGNHNTASPYYENLFNPEGAVVLSAFTGENAQGNWTLRVCDDAGSDTGTIRRVALQFDGTPTVIAIPGHIIGYVFQDYDSDGTKDSGPVVDGGVANVTVTAYDAAGATFSAVTDSTGAYDIDASAGTGPFRVEFTNLPSGYYPTYHNSNSGSNSAAPNSTATTAGTTVQFVPTAGVSNVNLGINRPLNYTAGAVGFAVSVMRASAASGQTNLATRYGYISLPYDATGDATGVGDKNNPDFTKDVAFADIGTTWGAAYQRRSGLLFAGAVMKRHQGLGPLVEPTVGAGVQNVPVDGIYMINYGGSVGGTKVGGFTLNGVTPAAGNLGAIDTGTVQRETINTTVTTAKPYALSTTSEDSFDVDAFNKAGKIGFGDVEISEDGQSLWIVNLNQKSLIRIDVSNFSGLPTSGAIDGALLAHYAIDFGELPACTGEYRPWGLNFHAGSGYIGVVCDGSSGTHGDLHAHVLEFDPVTVTGFTSVVDINLAPSTYVRESAQFETAYATCTLGTQQGWNRWANSWADLGVSGNTNTVFGGEAACPQPILSGIAFADNGDMILGLMDRSTLQLDRANWAADTAQGTTTFYSIDGGGDTIHVCDTAGGYVVEGFTGCVIDNDTKTTGDSPTTRLSAADGPNGQGEFYYGDYSSVYDTAGSARHVENNLGAVLTVPGSDQVLVTGYDVILGDFNQGFHWYQTRTGANPGARVSQYQISVEGANDVNTKGMNLGDIELLSPAAPIEIGNRIWNDADGDGIQDPDEAPISGVTVELYKNGVKIGEATSDATGEYYFTSGTNATDSDANDNIIHDSGIGILPGTGAVGGNSLYELRIPNITGGSKQAALGSNSLTTANAGSNDSIDSNGTVSGDDAIYAIPHADLADSGYNNHTYDFGFGPDAPDVGAITVNKTVNGAPAPAGWQFTLSSSNCTLPGGLTNPATTADGSGGSVSWANLLVEDGSSSACLYIVSETVQSGYTLSTTLSSSLTGITLTANMTTPLTVVNVEDTLPPSKVSIGNLVWEDGNDNARYDVGEDLIDNLTMELWLDLDNDGIAEPLGDDGSTPLSTTVTVNGIYSFTNLMPGNYFVRIPAPPPVTPLSSIPSDAPDNGVDNDDNGSQPGGPNTQILSPVIVLIAGEEPGQGGGGNDDMTVDFGLVDPFIGNLVWYDKNNDGDVDVDEPGIPGVTVQVFLDADDNGTIDAGESTPFRTTTTNQEGIYTFSDLLPASNYLVVIPQSNFVAGGALALYRYSSDNTDTNDNQEDEDDNGIQASPGLTTTAPMVRLTVDEEPTDGDSETGRGNDLDNGDDNNGDMTVDFGFYSMGTIQIVKQATGGDDTFTFSSADGDLDGLSLTTSGGVAGSTVITKLVGAYTISETLPTDWFLIGISVSGDSDNGSSKDLVNGAMTIDLDANEQIVVTFKNIKGELPTGSSVLTITKSVVGDPGGITSYTVAVDGSTGYYTETTVTPGAPTVLTGLAAGIYTVTETSPGAGWVMTYTVDAVTSNTEGVVDLTNAANVTPVTAGPISGKVFRDFNSDGLITADGTVTDSGVSGVTVTAYDKDGNPAGSATTGIDGTYTINPTADGPYRVEFTNLPDGFEPTTRGTGNGTSVQFVTTSGAGNVNLGVNPPCDYCQDNVNLVDTLMNIGVQTGPNQSPPSPNPAFPDARNKTTVVPVYQQQLHFRYGQQS